MEIMFYNDKMEMKLSHTTDSKQEAEEYMSSDPRYFIAGDEADRQEAYKISLIKSLEAELKRLKIDRQEVEAACRITGADYDRSYWARRRNELRRQIVEIEN